MNIRNLEDQDFGGDRPPSNDILAGEYALGLLSAEDRLDAEARIERDPSFARLVLEWQQRLAPWLEATDAVEPPAYVWPKVRSRLGWSAVERDAQSLHSPVAPVQPTILQRTGFWRATTGLAVAATIAAFFFGRNLSSNIDAPTPGPVVVVPTPVEDPNATKPVTTLAREDGRTGWLASVDNAKGTVLMVPVPSAADAQGRVPELWLIPPGEAPKSLGLVSIDRAHTVKVPDALRDALRNGALLAVSLEPQGGAPQGSPTGPIIAKGDIVTL